jgi:hypothetical protein
MQQAMEVEVMAKRMGGLGKLSDFGKTNQPQPQVEAEVTEVSTQSQPAIEATPQLPQTTDKPKQVEEKLVTVNIKITRSQQEWLSDTARDIRGNNPDPVPPNERVFPQHLIGVAIDLLESSDIDWSRIKNIQDLRKGLKL